MNCLFKKYKNNPLYILWEARFLQDKKSISAKSDNDLIFMMKLKGDILNDI